LFARRSKSSSKDSEESAAAAKARHRNYRQQTFPPAFPNGWYKLCNANELERGQVKYLEACGQHLAVFRGKDNGKVAVLEAWCPHLGANLAVEGTVIKDCLKCPFHEWSFDMQGNVANVPYYDGEMPSNARAKVFPCEERLGYIMFWFDAENRQPTWHLPLIPEIETTHTMTYRGMLPAKIVNMHIQDFEENGVDYAHFPVLHSRFRWPWTQFDLPFIRVHHTASFELDEKIPQIAYFKNNAKLQIFGRDIPRTNAHATIHFNGSGGVVYMVFDIPDVGRVILFETHTPIEPMALKTEFSWWADRKINNLLVSYIVGQWYSQWANDLSIWENKIYRRPPLILKTDGPVAKFRRWYAQFYSENSEKVSKASQACSW